MLLLLSTSSSNVQIRLVSSELLEMASIFSSFEDAVDTFELWWIESSSNYMKLLLRFFIKLWHLLS